VAKHGKPPKIMIAKCPVCDKEFRDYASNRRKGEEHFCSAECRAAWAGVHNSISRGGDGQKRSKADKDALDYRKHATKRRQKATSYYQKNRDAILAEKQAKNLALKKEIVAAYGGKCRCCGEDHIEFLTIDHMNGDGAAHRARTGKGRKIYQDLKEQGFPQDGYQLLCLNCNIALGFYGYCPHHPEITRPLNHVPRKPGRPRTVK